MLGKFQKLLRMFENWHMPLAVLIFLACFDSAAIMLYFVVFYSLGEMLLPFVIIGFVSGLFTFCLWIANTRGFRNKLSTLNVDKERLEVLETELSMAKTVQKQLYPKKEAVVDSRFDIYGFSVASTENKVSGDYFDMFQWKEVIYFGIGDVSGHGLSSAILSMLANRKFRSHIKLKSTNFPNIIEDIHNEMTEASKHMSILLGYIDKGDQIHLYGRQESLIVCGKDDVETHDISESGFLIGTLGFNRKKIPYFTIDLPPGDFLIMYSDGITEAENPESTTLGLKGLLSYVSDNREYLRTLDSHKITDAILRYTSSWSKGFVEDDRTVLVIRRI